MFDDDTETTKRKKKGKKKRRKSVLLKPQVATPFASVGDELLMLMQQSKLGDSQGLFARELKAAPEPGVTNCKTSWGSVHTTTVLTTNPTFCLGNFEVAPITYRSLLKSHRTDYPRVFILPAFLI